MTKCFVGVDVSKDTLDVHILHGPVRQVANDPQGWQALLDLLSAHRPELIVLEATGGYERLVVAALGAAGLPVVVINPRQARDFAKGIGLLAKTDRIDAYGLACFAEKVRPPEHPLLDEHAQKLKEMLSRRGQLVEMRTMESNRLKQALARRVQLDLQRSIAFLDKQIKRLEQDIDDAIRKSPLWQEKLELLQSVPGVGDQTARMLVVELSELGTCSRNRIAALVGVAPLAEDSGKRTGKRSIRGGRKSVRCTLYMAALTAVRFNPKIRAHYQKLRETGKPFKVAIVACMHKLLTILNAILRDRKAWQPPAETA